MLVEVLWNWWLWCQDFNKYEEYDIDDDVDYDYKDYVEEEYDNENVDKDI